MTLTTASSARLGVRRKTGHARETEMKEQPLRYAVLADELAELIASGIFQPGERLPSVRRLAAEKRLSISTVVQALHQLEDAGAIEVRPQSGFFVRQRRPAQAEPRAGVPPEQAVAVQLSQRLMRVLQANMRPGVAPLGAALPAPELLPIAAIHRLYARVARRYPDLLAGASHTDMNDPALLRQLVRRSLGWGGPLASDEIVVTHSCTEALHLCLRAVTKPGETVAVESPAYYLMLQLLESCGLKALEIPSSPGSGLSVDALELATRHGQVAACLLVPNASNPLGAIMPDADKARLAALMAERGVPVIEDDIYGDLHFDGLRPWPIKAFDQTGNVMLCSSFSKSISPALRIGFVAAGRYFADVALQKTIVSGATNPLTQRVLAEYLESGTSERHLRRLRGQYAHQVEQMMLAVARYFPAGTRFSRPQGGFVLWVELPESVDTMQLYEWALAAGIAFLPGQMFSPSALYGNCLRLNCGNPWTPAIEAAIAQLGELAGQFAKKHAKTNPGPRPTPASSTTPP